MSKEYDKLLRCYHSVREKINFEPQVALIMQSRFRLRRFWIIMTLKDFRSLRYLGTKEGLYLAISRMFRW